MHAVKNGITISFRPSLAVPDALEIVTRHDSERQGQFFSMVKVPLSLFDGFNGSHEDLLQYHLSRLVADIISVDLTDGSNPR